MAKEEKLRIQEEERLAKEAEEARIKAEKEEAERLAKEAELEAKEAEEAKKKAEEERLAKEAEKESKVVSIRGRILKGKNGVPGVQVRVLTEDEEKIYLTNKNGFYKITNLVKDENYTITVVSGKTAFDISPKVRVFKNNCSSSSICLSTSSFLSFRYGYAEFITSITLDTNLYINGVSIPIFLPNLSLLLNNLLKT